MTDDFYECRRYLIVGACIVAAWLSLAFFPRHQVLGTVMLILLSVSTVPPLLFLLGVRPARPAHPKRPVILPRQPEPFCFGCEMAEAVSDERRERLAVLAPFSSFGLSQPPPYEAHRDCWVTTGSEKELERMLRHVTWTSS